MGKDIRTDNLTNNKSQETISKENVSCDFCLNEESSFIDFTQLVPEDSVEVTASSADADVSSAKDTGSSSPSSWRRITIPELRATLKRFDKVNSSYQKKEEFNIETIMLNENLAREVLSNIGVIAFVGPSGTGKSTRAIRVARENNISFFIDDGLLINGSRILAGTSAKKAPTKMESVRQALFSDETRSSVMRRALIEHRPTTLMILGTSDSMLSKICNNLWLNKPVMLIRIEDVSTEEEMRMARNTRMTEGMHTIPVPTMEIKHEFSGYFSDPFNKIRQRFDRERGVTPIANDTERTVVRPTFSSLGSYSISDDALLDIIKIVLGKVDGVANVVTFKSEKRTYGVVLSLGIALFYGYDAQQVLLNVQQNIGNLIEEYTSITVIAVNVKAQRLIH
ncbi:MAG: hypothetical protein MJ172_00215 [Clostridia bacterium]|nr:hypothetical protein [Clostridia bacterium]